MKSLFLIGVVFGFRGWVICIWNRASNYRRFCVDDVFAFQENVRTKKNIEFWVMYFNYLEPDLCENLLSIMLETRGIFFG